MLKRIIVLLIAALLLSNVGVMAASTKEGEDVQEPVQTVDVPTLSYKDFEFTVTSNTQNVLKIGYMLYPYPKKPQTTPVLEGHIPLAQVPGTATYKTGKLDTSGVKSGKYVLQYWLECNGSRSVDIINLTLPSPKNTVYKQDTITIKTKTVNALADNRPVGKLMVVKSDDTVFYADSKFKQAARTFSRGEVVEVKAEKASYMQVMVDLQMYYVKSKFLLTPDKFAKESPEDAIPVMACVTALKQRGSTYVWGANGTKLLDGKPIFDCSGFTFFSYKTAGLGWSRYAAYNQAAHAWFDRLWRGSDPWADPQNYAIARASLKPGDLLFFQTSANPAAWRKGITHCGIYIGNGKMVHAGDPVHVENVDEFAQPVIGEVDTNRIRAITRLRPYAERSIPTTIPVE